MNDEELLRYSRHIMMPDFDYSRQQQLLQSTVLIVGAGGLGCSAGLYLAASGIGKIIIVDDDHVELSNLQRQIAFQETAINHNKAQALKHTIMQLNHHIECDAIAERMDENLADRLIASVDLVLDCTDNFSTRAMINRLAVRYQKVLVSAAAIRSEGQISVFDTRQECSPCYACLYGDDTDQASLNCSETGVLSPVVGVVGAMQAVEAIKALSDFGESLVGRLLLYDAKYGEWRSVNVPKDPNCPICSM